MKEMMTTKDNEMKRMIIAKDNKINKSNNVIITLKESVTKDKTLMDEMKRRIMAKDKEINKLNNVIIRFKEMVTSLKAFKETYPCEVYHEGDITRVTLGSVLACFSV